MYFHNNIQTGVVPPIQNMRESGLLNTYAFGESTGNHILFSMIIFNPIFISISFEDLQMYDL